MKCFADMPVDYRMAARAIIDDHGGMVAGYCGDACQVALPNDGNACRSMTLGLEAMGLVGDSYCTWEPLGSDAPPESLRHFGIGTAACPRGNTPGYWKYRDFRVA